MSDRLRCRFCPACCPAVSFSIGLVVQLVGRALCSLLCDFRNALQHVCSAVDADNAVCGLFSRGPLFHLSPICWFTCVSSGCLNGLTERIVVFGFFASASDVRELSTIDDYRTVVSLGKNNHRTAGK